MGLERSRSRFFPVMLLIIIVSNAAFGLSILSTDASPDSNYLFKYTVNREGFTAVEINFNSTDSSGDSWVLVPKDWDFNYTKANGQITTYPLVETDQVIGQSLYFYRAFRFHYVSSGIFNMTLRFSFDNGALIMEPRGIFYSPQIGFQDNSIGNAVVNFDPSFQINQDLAIVVGTTDYPVQTVELNRAYFTIPRQENVVRLQVEFSINAVLEETPLKSSDNIFTFNTPSRYANYSQSVLRFYDRIYNQTAGLFNVTLDNVDVQWFLPDFESLLSVGGYVPIFTGGLGEININIVFIRTVNGTIEIIAAHELVHRFLGKAGIGPNDFLWFHEGMAQYISVNIVSDLGYEGAQTEKDNLENGASSLIQELGGENFAQIGLQSWSPTYQPPNANVDSLYLASYYVASRLPQVAKSDGFEYYQRFFELIGQLPSDFNGVKINGISELALYLSQAANASVALTLKRWGFSLTDLYKSPIQDLIVEAGEAVGGVNPIFQPYKALADYLYGQALLSAEQSDWGRASNLLQLSITFARLAPLLTFLTILAILALLVFILTRQSRKRRLVVPPPPPEIMQA